MSARRTVVDHAADASTAGRQPPDGDPWLAAEHAVDLVRALFEAQVVALFGVAGERLILLASYGLTQGVLDSVVGAAWAHQRPALAAGQPHESADLAALVLPCSDERCLSGLAYIEGPGVRRRSNLSLLVPLSQILARVARGAAGPSAVSPADGQETLGNADAAQLYVLMERHEWNVARVARFIGVTRMTVYNRLRRAGLARKRVAKAPRRKHRPPGPASPGEDTRTAS
jgi:hypothetical protein